MGGRHLALEEDRVREVLRAAAAERARLMWPWESPGASAACSILDDETYDWLAVVEGMLVSGGFPNVLPEELLVRANRLAREASGVPADPTGTAGWAGCLALAEGGLSLAGETVVVLFTGVERPTAGGSAAAAGSV